MKKIILILLCFFCFSLPCLSANLLQQQDELRFAQKTAKEPLPTSYGKDYLIREDYFIYKNGGESTYGLILYFMKEAKNKNNLTDYQYLNLAKTKIETIVKLKNNDIDNNMRLNAVNKKIVIDDADYKKLSQDTKDLLNMVNYLMFE